MVVASADAEVRDLLQRAACLPYGLALVEHGLTTCVADILGASGELVARARGALSDDATRPALVDAFAQAARWRDENPEAFCDRCQADGRTPTPGCPLAVIREAEKQPGGLESLRSASLEAAAVSFHVHPFVILGAREWLKRRTEDRRT